MKDLARILVTGYLVKKFLAPKVYPVLDEALEALPVELPSRLTTIINGQEVVVSDPPAKEITPFEAVEQSIIVDRHEIIAEPSLVVSNLVYPRRRS